MKMNYEKFQRLVADLLVHSNYMLSYDDIYNAIFNHFVVKYDFLVLENSIHEVEIFRNKYKKRALREERKRFKAFIARTKLNKKEKKLLQYWYSMAWT